MSEKPLTIDMKREQRRSSIIEFVDSTLESMDEANAIGVIFFYNNSGQIEVHGEIAGVEVFSSESSLFDSLDQLKDLIQLSEPDITESFGGEVLIRSLSSEESNKLSLAVPALNTYLENKVPGPYEVSSRPSGTLVVRLNLSSFDDYSGPWEYEGFPVILENLDAKDQHDET